MKIRKSWFAAVFCILILCGCGRNHTQSGTDAGIRVVTSIDISGITDQEVLQLRYTTPEKIDVILNYLRILRQRGQAFTDPEQLPGNSFWITLNLSDGQQQLYRQHADKFLSKNNAPWHYVRQEHAEYLLLILQAMPSDA